MHIPAYVLIIGYLAQVFFTARVLCQWILSERARKVVSPAVFWALSLAGSYLLFAYGWLRNDFSIMLGQIIGYYVYIWNLWLKGVWQKIPQGLRQVVIGLLLLTPVVTIGAILAKNDTATLYNSLFRNEGIPVWLLVFGCAGQVIFSLRFLYQWYCSARLHYSVLPAWFWGISLAGSIIILIYALIRLDPVLLLAQGFGFVIYARNLYLCHKYGVSQEDKKQ